MSELKWPSEEEVRKMFAKKEGFGSDATLSAVIELPEVQRLLYAISRYHGGIKHHEQCRELRYVNVTCNCGFAALDAALAAIKETKP